MRNRLTLLAIIAPIIFQFAFSGREVNGRWMIIHSAAGARCLIDKLRVAHGNAAVAASLSALCVPRSSDSDDAAHESAAQLRRAARAFPLPRRRTTGDLAYRAPPYRPPIVLV